MYKSEQEIKIPDKGKCVLKWLIICSWSILLFNCRETSQPAASILIHITPTYGNIRLVSQPDTLHFRLGENTYNKIKSFNYFVHKDRSFMSFYDHRTESVAIYDFHSLQPVKKIRLKKSLKDRRFYKTSVYTQNFDSIYVTNLDTLYLLDSSGRIKQNIPFLGDIEAMAFFETPVPVVKQNNIIYMGVRAFVKETSLSDIRAWKVLCGFNLESKTPKLHYQLPAVYRKGLYGRRFLEYSYCYNDKGHFVFSFSADTNIYETNLTDYHVGFYAKSRLQNSAIEPVSKKALENDEGGKEYTLRDSYGPIYYDPYKKRYLRIARQKVSKTVYESKNFQRTNSLIVLDEHFKIIGEFLFNNDFSLNTIFFTPNGDIYARVNEKDENALHFVRLAWSGEPDESIPLTQK